MLNFKFRPLSPPPSSHLPSEAQATFANTAIKASLFPALSRFESNYVTRSRLFPPVCPSFFSYPQYSCDIRRPRYV